MHASKRATAARIDSDPKERVTAAPKERVTAAPRRVTATPCEVVCSTQETAVAGLAMRVVH